MSPSEISDAELLERVAGGGLRGREAESLLCARFAPRVRLYGLKHLRNRVEAEDLMQQVLIRLLEAARAGSIQERDKVDRFVLGTCRLTAQRMKVRGKREEPSASERLDAVVEPFEPVEVAALLRCLGALEQRAGRVVSMSFQEERSAEDVASVLAMTAGNVRVVRHRALMALRECLDRGRDSQGGLGPLPESTS